MYVVRPVKNKNVQKRRAKVTARRGEWGRAYLMESERAMTMPPFGGAADPFAAGVST